MSRRGFVGGGIALSALASTPLQALPEAMHPEAAHDPSAIPGAPVRPFRFVVDQRLPNAEKMAAAAVREGHTLLPVASDPGSAWMNVIEPRLRNGPAALGGITTGATLFCLEYLSRDYGLGSACRLHGGPRPTPEWIARAAAFARNRSDEDLTNLAGLSGEQPDQLIELSGDRARSIFAWMLVPKRKLMLT